jgi:hypothetical protein
MGSFPTERQRQVVPRLFFERRSRVLIDGLLLGNFLLSPSINRASLFCSRVSQRARIELNK